MRVASVYLPNGNPVESDKFAYKLAWMERLLAHATASWRRSARPSSRRLQRPYPADGDCHDPAAWEGDALTRPDSRARFRALLNLGYTEAWRALHAETTSTATGTFRAAPGRATRASASTICCSRRGPQTGSSAARSTAPRAASRRPRTTRRCGASWVGAGGTENGGAIIPH